MSEQPSKSPVAGWYQDPQNASQLRWWDGAQWTENTSPQPSGSTTPPLPPALPAATPTAPSSKGRGWKLFFIITGAILAAVVILVVGCSALVSSSLDSGGGGGDNADGVSGGSARQLPQNAKLIKKTSNSGENPDFTLDADVPATSKRFYLVVNTKPAATVSAVTSASCNSPDYGKTVSGDFEVSDLFSNDNSYGKTLTMPRGWKPGWNCNIYSTGRASTDAGKVTKVTARLFRAR